MRRGRISLQTRLTLLVLGSALLFGMAAAYESYESATHEAGELFDEQLSQLAQNMLGIAIHTEHDMNEHEGKRFAPPPVIIPDFNQRLIIQAWSIAHDPPRELLRSAAIPDGADLWKMPKGFSTHESGGMRWRYFMLRDSRRGIGVLVGENDWDRNELARKVAWYNIAPFLFGLPVLVLLTLLAVRFGLTPLRRLADSLRDLKPEQLRPVAMASAPKEIVPVVDALNGLLGRIARVLENERRFTADAAHELRTPIAALQAQIQAAQLARNREECNDSLAGALDGTERMAHLVNQLLTLSRLDENLPPEGLEQVDLAGVVRECCAEAGRNALLRDIEIGFSAQIEPEIAGSADMLRILLRNLLDNAIRYTPPGGRVEVLLHPPSGGGIELEVSDSGRGVPDDELGHLGERFHRMSPSGGAPGVGLGLSIVRRIAELHRAQLAFGRSMLGGLSVKLRFPR